MANLTINGKNIQQEGSLLFGEFLEALNRELAARQQVVSSIRINGELLDEAKEQRFSMMALNHLGIIEIATDDPIDLAFEALKTAKEYIRKIMAHSRQTGELYKDGKSDSAERGFLDLVDSLDNLTNLILSAQSVLRTKYKNIHTDDPSLRIAQVRLVSAVEELVPAKRENNRELLMDVLLNELPDALREMREHGLPVLQRLRTR